MKQSESDMLTAQADVQVAQLRLLAIEKVADHDLQQVYNRSDAELSLANADAAAMATDRQRAEVAEGELEILRDALDNLTSGEVHEWEGFGVSTVLSDRDEDPPDA